MTRAYYIDRGVRPLSGQRLVASSLQQCWHILLWESGLNGDGALTCIVFTWRVYGLISTYSFEYIELAIVPWFIMP